MSNTTTTNTTTMTITTTTTNTTTTITTAAATSNLIANTTTAFTTTTSTSSIFFNPTNTANTTANITTAAAAAAAAATTTTTAATTTTTTTSTSSIFSNPTTTAFAFSNPIIPAFTFGNPTTAEFTFGSLSTTTFTFGKPTTPKFTFNNPTTTGFTFGNPTTTAFTFSNPTTTATFTFSNSSSTFPKAKVEICDTLGRIRQSRTKFHSVEKELEKLKASSNVLQKSETPLFIEASTQTGEELYESKLLQGLKGMLLNSKHSDFVLNVKGMEFRVHKIILEAQSPVFAAMFEHDTKEKADGVANIDDCEPHTMTKFLNFLYTERVDNLTSDDALDLYKVADKYQVTELSSLCIKCMKSNISIENFCDILTLSLNHHVKELTETATQFFLLNSTEIAVTAKWQTFLIENPIAGNELFLKALKLGKK